MGMRARTGGACVRACVRAYMRAYLRARVRACAQCTRACLRAHVPCKIEPKPTGGTASRSGRCRCGAEHAGIGGLPPSLP